MIIESAYFMKYALESVVARGGGRYAYIIAQCMNY